MKMDNEHYTMTVEGMTWTVKDEETGFAITFAEGLFNETQEVKEPDTLPNGEELASFAASAMRGIGDYIATEHPDIATCDIYARREAIWTLANEKYWVTMAAACNSLLINFNENQAEYLFTEVKDFIELDGTNPAGLNEGEEANLLGSLSMLDDEQAEEVFTMLLAFWNEHYNAGTPILKWASEVLWWPVHANDVIDKLEENGED